MPVLVPPVQTALWAAAQHVVARRVLEPRRPGRLAKGLAVACFAGGAASAAGASSRFRQRGTTWEPWAPERSTALVTDGPNAVTRNPMYVGMTLVVVGSGLLSGRPWTALAAGGLMTTLTPQVEREEAALARLFGEEWTAYSSRVRRWV
ncbi:methyltransferase family protein [Nocardioides sp. GXQ0305]|uniref:methyltransferase family protein n=1 Tax=Nocardioides sp. GXQ0305 TaxID=3423912 RepID=UPI003D7CE3FC